MKTSFKVLHEKALHITKSYLKAESDLISILQEIDDCRGYREMGFKSLFDYATQSLGLSESVSFNFITIARKSREVPKLQEMIQKQEITVSNARMIAPVLNPENQDRWLSSAAELSKRELEKEIAREFPEKQVQERTRYVSGERLELKLGISQDLHELLKRVQDLVSSQSGKSATLEATFHAALTFYVEKKDPMEKAKRAETKEAKAKHAETEEVKVKHLETIEAKIKGSESKLGISDLDNTDQSGSRPVPGQIESSRGPRSLKNSSAQQNPRFIPAKLEHAVRLRDQGQCTYHSTPSSHSPQGGRCSEKRWLEIHHVKPLSEGGATTLENLTLICRGHHQVIHHIAQEIPMFKFG